MQYCWFQANELIPPFGTADFIDSSGRSAYPKIRLIEDATGATSLSSVVQVPKSAMPALLRLMRPANIVTAHADILAGYAASGAAEPWRLASLLVATTGLYGGGIVFNDVFDARLDAVERPERPIPSGLVSLRGASVLGGLLLAAGVLAAYVCSPLSGAVALATAASAIVYDSVGKHHSLIGPFNMGLCRGLNLLLGLTAASQIDWARAPLALVTLCYIAGITSLSRGEVRGGTQTAASIAAGWLGVGLIVLIALASSHRPSLLAVAPFFLLLLLRIAPPFWQAFHTLEPQKIRIAVRAGILSLIVLDAGLAALFGGFWYGLATLALYLPAMLLAKSFAVT
jgi:4-hydroxybenzoate polyprenyltransferase